MITTIQLNESVKKTLNMLKNGKETYEDVIVNLIDKVDADRKKMEGLLKEEALEFAEESLKIAKEWEFALMDGLDKNEKW
ncbi:MAG: hypothetical protein AABX91_01750 [Nanoarchaeota archaeon]|mgnify:FL=1